MLIFEHIVWRSGVRYLCRCSMCNYNLTDLFLFIGKHRKRRRDPKLISVVLKHVDLFPAENHYCREKARHRKYISVDGINSVAKMYSLYKDWVRNEDEFTSADEARQTMFLANEASYRDIFCRYRNLGFKQVEDGCEVCLYYQRRGQQWHPIYKRHRILEREMRALHQKDADDNNDRTHCLVVDLGSVKLMPKVKEGYAYYLSKISVYPLPIHDLKDNSAHVLVWPEVEGGRDTDSIISALFYYFKKIMPTLEKFGPEGFDTLKIWFDNCAGQNKAQFNVAFWYFLVHVSETFKTVEVYFLEHGHSFNACDRDMGLWELKISKAGDVSSIQHLYRLLREARVDKPFEVVELSHGDFTSWGDFTNKFFSVLNAPTTDGPRLKFKPTRIWRFTKDKPGIMQFKYTPFEKEIFKEAQILKSTARVRSMKAAANESSRLFLLSTPFPDRIPITKRKRDALLKMMPSIEPSARAWYKDLPCDVRKKEKVPRKGPPRADDSFIAQFDQFMPEKDIDVLKEARMTLEKKAEEKNVLIDAPDSFETVWRSDSESESDDESDSESAYESTSDDSTSESESGDSGSSDSSNSDDSSDSESSSDTDMSPWSEKPQAHRRKRKRPSKSTSTQKPPPKQSQARRTAPARKNRRRKSLD